MCAGGRGGGGEGEGEGTNSPIRPTALKLAEDPCDGSFSHLLPVIARPLSPLECTRQIFSVTGSLSTSPGKGVELFQIRKPEEGTLKNIFVLTGVCICAQ